MKYTVAEIRGTYPANFGQTRVEFTVKEGEHAGKKLSGFLKSIPTPGDAMDGDIVQKGQYLNFVLPKAPRPGFTPQGSGVDTEKILEALRKVYSAVQTADTSAKMAMGKVELLTKRLEVKGVLDVIEDRTSAGTKVPFTDAKEKAQEDLNSLYDTYGK